MKMVMLVASAVVLAGASACSRAAAPPRQDALAGPVMPVSARGRIEGADETRRIGLGRDGVIASLSVKEGDAVRKGDVLLQLDCRDVSAAAAAAESQREAAVQEERRLVRGARPEERREAQALLESAAAVEIKARLDLKRAEDLVAAAAASRAELEAARRDFDVAVTQREAARQRADLASAAALPEELARVVALVAQRRFERDALLAQADMCVARAPADGVVLRILARTGERVTAASARPVMTLADVSHLRVRAEVDERDLGRVRVGHVVRVRAEAFGTEALTGRVVSIGKQMEVKSVVPVDPAEPRDRDVVEVLVDLDRADPRAVIGLRVSVAFDGWPAE